MLRMRHTKTMTLYTNTPVLSYLPSQCLSNEFRLTFRVEKYPPSKTVSYARFQQGSPGPPAINLLPCNYSVVGRPDPTTLAFDISSEARRESFCIKNPHGRSVNSWSWKSRSSRMDFRPLLLEIATYALKAVILGPVAGFPMSTITCSIVWPCER